MKKEIPKKTFYSIIMLTFFLMLVLPIGATYYDLQGTNVLLKGFMEIPEQANIPGTPDTGSWRLYTYSDGVYVKDDAGAATNLLAPLLDDIADPDANSAIDLTTYTLTMDSGAVAGDMFVKELTGNFGDISGVLIEQKTGSPTDGTLLELKLANAEEDPDFVSFKEGAQEKFKIDADGIVTIDDDGDAGAVIVEGTNLDINSLDFVGAGAITGAADSAITINPDSGDAAGEDLIVTANNIQLTATGAITMSPDVAVTTALTVTDVDYTNALSVGTLAIVGTTGIIDYTNFDVDTDGDVTCVDITASGTANIGTWAQDAIIPASASPQVITLDGGGAGGVTIGATSTGNITLGDDVVVSDTYNVTIGEGSLTVDNDQNEDALVITSSATSQSAIEITNAATTTGKMIQANADDLGTAGVMLYLDSDNMAADNYYMGLYDGSGYDFTVGQYGAAVIAGNAATDVLTLTAGDIEITTGDIDLNDGILSVDNDADEANNITRAFAGAGTNPVLTVKEDHTSSTSVALLVENDGTAGATGLQISHDGDLAAIDIDAGVARTGPVIDILMTNQEAQNGLQMTGAWTGASDIGMINLNSTGSIAAGASMIFLNSDTGTPGASGFGIEIDDDSVDGGTFYSLLINSANNEGLHVELGTSLFAEEVTFSGGVNVGASAITGTTGIIDYTNFDVDTDGSMICTNIDASGTVTVTGATSLTGASLTGDGATLQYGFVALPVDGGSGPVNIEIADSGKVYFNSEACTFNLPPAAAGLEYSFVVAHASQITIDPDGVDRILILTDTNGDKITSSTAGDTVTLYCVGAGIWYVKSIFPEYTDWADGGA